jgi:GTPase SAR1 family protein/Ca2+-binding EF-hand superfamily protein
MMESDSDNSITSSDDDDMNFPFSKNKIRSVKLLLVGDGGVGKSSLISTFVSRHFSDIVPATMTRLTLPPDSSLDGSIITTIIDSKGCSSSHISGASQSKLESLPVDEHDYLVGESGVVDSEDSYDDQSFESNAHIADAIILVYDVTKPNSFQRLEDYWLPKIENCDKKELPVIIVGNKVDLTSEPNTAKVVALLQRFKFVRESIKCSAKTLFNLDDVFLKAQQAVLYPISPALYDLENGCIALSFKRALMRIFRIYDVDMDGLLSVSELNSFQTECFNFPLSVRDFIGWKKVVSRNCIRGNTLDEDFSVVRDGKFTFTGFVAIFEVFISQNRLDIPWKILRKFGYDNDIKLHLPRCILKSDDKCLPVSVRHFLRSIFLLYDSNHDGIMDVDDLLKCFFTLPEPSLPPWHPTRMTMSQKGSRLETKHQVVSVDYTPSIPSDSSFSASGITICSSETPPSLQSDDQLSDMKPLSMVEWMGLWYMMYALQPKRTMYELCSLGYDALKFSANKIIPNDVISDGTHFATSEYKVLIVGNRGIFKPSFIDLIETFDYDHDRVTIFGGSNHQICSHSSNDEILSATSFAFIKSSSNPTYLILTEISSDSTNHNEVEFIKKTVNNYDLVLFVVHDTSTFNYVQEIESMALSDDTPRLFAITKSDAEGYTKCFAHLLNHCMKLDLESPFEIRKLSEQNNGSVDLIQFIARSFCDRTLRAIPFAKRKRRNKVLKKVFWFSSLFSGIALVVGVGFSITRRQKEHDIETKSQVSFIWKSLSNKLWNRI